MRSTHAEVFNHDEEAAGYDRDVRNEDDPIRAGYRALLEWVAVTADVQPNHTVLDLGAGTGNLTQLLAPCRAIRCVDVSTHMLEIARAKLAERTGVTYAVADLLEWFDACEQTYDRVVSTYAVHHLTPDERAHLFRGIHNHLASGGRAVFGDLMFQDAAARAAQLNAYRASGRKELAADIEDEFFWDVAVTLEQLAGIGFRAEARQFSDLSWGITAYKPRGTKAQS